MSSSETRTYDTLLSSVVAKYMDKKYKDNVGKANALYWVLSQDGFKVIQDGGERIEQHIRMTKSTSGGWYENYDPLNTTPADPISKVFFPWRQIHYTVVMSRMEERKNSGAGKLFALAQALIDDAEDSMTEDINGACFGAATAANKQCDGLQNLIAEDPTSATGGRAADGLIGGLSQATNTFWRNKVVGEASLTWIGDNGDTPAVPTGWVQMERLFENCSKGGGAKGKREPNFCIANQAGYRNYLTGLSMQKRFTNTKLADAGFRNVTFNDMPITWDEAAISATCTTGTSTTELFYFLNKYFIHLVVDKETDFYSTPFIRPANQDARLMNILHYINLTVTSRRKQGILVGSALTEVE